MSLLGLNNAAKIVAKIETTKVFVAFLAIKIYVL